MAHRPRPKATANAPAAKLRMCSATAKAARLCEVRVFKPATVINPREAGATF
jgi:prephenate dehydratase